MKAILHKIAHFMSWNYGKVVTWYDENERLMVGFKCSTCGEITGAEQAFTQTTGTKPQGIFKLEEK